MTLKLTLNNVFILNYHFKEQKGLKIPSFFIMMLQLVSFVINFFRINSHIQNIVKIAEGLCHHHREVFKEAFKEPFNFQH